jgi:DNA-binding response OmpR family regulator
MENSSPQLVFDADATPPTILIVDDEDVIRNAFQLYFETMGYNVTTAENGEKAIDVFTGRRGEFDIVLLDLVMPGTHGLEVLRRIKRIDRAVEVIIATGCGSMNTAIEAMREGAYDFVTKPVINLDDDLLTVVRGALRERRNRSANRPAETPHAVDESRGKSFYQGLESLARLSMAGSSRKEAEGEIVLFLEEHLRAVASFVVDEDEQGQLIPRPHSGALGSDSLAVAAAPLEGLAGMLNEAVAWRRVSGDGLRSSKHTEHETLEALCVPLSALANKPSGGGNERRTALIVLRFALGSTTPPPPHVAVLGLVVRTLLELHLAPASPSTLAAVT